MSKKHYSLQSAICILILIAACLLPAEAADTIAFIRNGDIYTVALDGTNLHRLTTDGRNAFPIWSPDGRRIAFAKLEGDHLSACLWITTPDGKYKRRLTKEEKYNSVFPIAWLPDMCGLLVSRHYLESDASPTLEVVTLTATPFRHFRRWMKASSESGFLQQFPERRCFAAGMSGDFAWSGDLVFTAATEWLVDAPRPDLYRMHFDGSGLRRLTVEPHWFIKCLRVNPITGTILTSESSVIGRQPASIKLRGSHGNVLWKLSDVGRASFSGIDWSPAGDYIIYQAMDPEYPKYEPSAQFSKISQHSSIWIMRDDGSGKRRFLSNACHPSWRNLAR